MSRTGNVGDLAALRGIMRWLARRGSAVVSLLLGESKMTEIRTEARG